MNQSQRNAIASRLFSVLFFCAIVLFEIILAATTQQEWYGIVTLFASASILLYAIACLATGIVFELIELHATCASRSRPTEN